MPNGRRNVHFLRAVTEIGFILFLFYANLLMGEFNRSGHHRTLLMAMRDAITPENFLIGFTAAVIGYAAIEFLRKKL